MPLQSQQPHRSRHLVAAAAIGIVIPLLPAGPEAVPGAMARTVDVVGARSLSGTTTLCTGYSDCAAKGYSDAGYRAASGRMYWQMYSGTNCTNYAAYRMVRAGMSNTRPWTGSGMARNWGKAMASVTNGTPAVGAIAWWKAGVGGAGDGGHVAYVEQVLSPTEIVISESNWGRAFDWRTVSATGNAWPSGFIHFLGSAPAPTAPAPAPTALTNLTAPVVQGEPRVLTTLTADPGTWSVPATYSYAWFANGKRINKATGSTFRARKARLGQSISVAVTATAPGRAPVTATAAATPPLGHGAIGVSAPPSVSGRAHVDEPLTVSPPVWAQPPDAVVIEWLVDGRPVPDAHGTTYTPGQADIGRTVGVRFIATKAGYEPTVVETGAIGPVGADEITVAAEPTLGGAPVVGRRLTVEGTVVSPADARVTYTWLRDGKPVRRAAGSPAYEVRRGDAGSLLSVSVRWQRPGSRDVERTLGAATAAAAKPELHVEARGARRAVVVSVRVEAGGLRRVGGTVTVTVGGRSRSAPVDRGLARVRVGKVRPGERVVTVSYAGSPKVLASEAVASARVARG